MEIIDRSFQRAPKAYILQSLFAVAAVMIILYFVDIFTEEAIVAALGASTFIVFAMPRAVTAQPRSLVGGHIVGLMSGSLCHFVFLTGQLGEMVASVELIIYLAYALSVGLSIFLMAITNTEHPPAAGTALGIVAHGWTYHVVIFVLVFAISLAIVRRLFRSRLRDLV